MIIHAQISVILELVDTNRQCNQRIYLFHTDRVHHLRFRNMITCVFANNNGRQCTDPHHRIDEINDRAGCLKQIRSWPQSRRSKMWCWVWFTVVLSTPDYLTRFWSVITLIPKVWTVTNKTDADPLNLDQKAVRWVVLIHVKNNCPCHWKSSEFK